MQAIQQQCPVNRKPLTAFATSPKYPVGYAYNIKGYPDRTLVIAAANWVGYWEYECTWNGQFVCKRSESDLEEIMLPKVGPGVCMVVPGYTRSDAVAITNEGAFKVELRLGRGKHRYHGNPSPDLIALMDPAVGAHFTGLPFLRYILLAEYEFGCCHSHEKTPHKTVKVKADSRAKALEEARTLLAPGTFDRVVYVDVSPNSEYAEMHP